MTVGDPGNGPSPIFAEQVMGNTTRHYRLRQELLNMATINGRRVTDGEWNLVYSTPKATLRAACKGEGLPVSGTGWQLAWRLIDAGISHEHVIERYSWRARLTPDPAIIAAVERSADAFARRWPNGNRNPNVRPVEHDRSDLP